MACTKCSLWYRSLYNEQLLLLFGNGISEYVIRLGLSQAIEQYYYYYYLFICVKRKNAHRKRKKKEKHAHTHKKKRFTIIH